TETPRPRSSRPSDATVIPLPTDDTTPPLTKMYLVTLASLRGCARSRFAHKATPALLPAPVSKLSADAVRPGRRRKADLRPPPHASPGSSDCRILHDALRGKRIAFASRAHHLVRGGRRGGRVSSARSVRPGARSRWRRPLRLPAGRACTAHPAPSPAGADSRTGGG